MAVPIGSGPTPASGPAVETQNKTGQVETNKWGDVAGTDSDGKPCFFDKAGDRYYLENDDYQNRTYKDSAGEYKKDGVGNKIGYVTDPVRFAGYVDGRAPVVFTHNDKGGRDYQDYEHNRYGDAPLTNNKGTQKTADGKTLYQDKEGDRYYLDHSTGREDLGRVFVDSKGSYYKDPDGRRFILNRDRPAEHFRTENGKRIYDNSALNTPPRAPEVMQAEAKNVNNVASGVFVGHVNPLYRESESSAAPVVGGGRQKPVNPVHGKAADSVEDSEDEGSVDEKEKIHGKEAKGDKSVDGKGGATESESKGIGDHKTKDLSGKVKKTMDEKIKQHGDREAGYLDLLHEKSVEKIGEKATVILAVVVLVLAVAALAALFAFSGGAGLGLAVGILAGAVGTIHAVQMGIHSGTRADSTLAAEAKKGRAKMNRELEENGDFVKALAKHDVRKNIARRTDVLSEKAQENYNAAFKEAQANKDTDVDDDDRDLTADELSEVDGVKELEDGDESARSHVNDMFNLFEGRGTAS